MTGITNIETFKVHLLQDDSIRDLYQQRLNLYLKQKPISRNINEEWEELKGTILQAASESLGTRNKNYNKKRLKVWNDDIAKLVKDKKDAYLKYLNLKTDENLIEYKKLSAIVRREVRKIKRTSWEKYISDIEHDVHGRQDKAYKILKHLNNQTRDNLKLNLIPQEEWTSYFKDLWTEETDEEIVSTLIDENVDPISFEELETTINNSKNKKTPGVDNINNELIKYASIQLKYRLLDLLNMCWKSGHIPEEWRMAKIYPVYKKGDRQNCENYRGISVLGICYKIYASILKSRFNVIMENIILEPQNGFRKGRSCSDCIFTINQIFEKHREYNIPTFILFVDLEKAFDKVNRNKLWNIMKQKGVPQHLITVIRSLYVENKILVETGTRHKNDITATINRGVRQGCPLSPSLFNVYIDDAIFHWQTNLDSHFKIQEQILDTLLFADDQVLISSSENDLQKATFQLSNILKNYNLNISTKKTKVLAFKGPDTLRAKIILDGKPIEQVNNFNYLGCNISYFKKEDLFNKLSKFNFICGTIKRSLKYTRRETKLKFYKVMAVPILLYGSEFWTLTKKEEKTIEAAEMRFLRSVAGCTLLDKRKSEDIRNELNIFKLMDKIEQYRNNWKEHVQSMKPGRIPKIILDYNPEGRRSVGRPKKRWIQLFN